MMYSMIKMFNRNSVPKPTEAFPYVPENTKFETDKVTQSEKSLKS